MYIYNDIAPNGKISIVLRKQRYCIVYPIRMIILVKVLYIEVNIIFVED